MDKYNNHEDDEYGVNYLKNVSLEEEESEISSDGALEYTEEPICQLRINSSTERRRSLR